MPLKLYNTLHRQLEEFTAPTEHVALYTCGPTVYNYLHVGNWAAYIYWDTLVRTLVANGYTPERVMNITDVGHLTGENEGDADTGEDKLQKGARREGKTAWQVAEFYAEDFLKGMEKLGLIAPDHVTRATEFIPQQLDLVRTLKQKGYTYQIDDGIYFDTAKFTTYASFAQLDLAAQKAGARVEFNAEKRNASDFALWKFSPAGEARDMEWDTPLDLLIDDQPRKGFPGWHLECSAMAMSILGETIDIHTGGIDHIPVHHTNEIAQSEAASGQTFSRYWLHNNHLKVNGTKISKSLGNGYTLDDLAERGYEPLDYRMFILQSHYQTEGNFTFDNLDAAKNRRHHWRTVAALRHQIHATLLDGANHEPSYAAIRAMLEAINNNLNTPEVLRLVDELFTELANMTPDDIDRTALLEVLQTIDELLGLQLIDTTPDIGDNTKKLIIERQRARDDKDWAQSDVLRDELLQQGIVVRDTPHGTIWQYA
jgi:cysteinyl-tRNA synthetase